ncbi:MAG: Gfo/Idh/MocA family oxidoreductase [Fuerstiella sp.]|nr:Gfo/Idh/MocA family oxidoreductase [Fuerstiella sp.]
MARNTNRRQFIGQSAGIGAAYWVGGGTQVKASRSALESLSAACVGVGGKGRSDSSNVYDQGVSIVGICDVDANTLQQKQREFRDAEPFSDYREMLDKLGEKVDIVTVSTPDHSHAAAASMAMKMGKHVYCQKPLTWSIYEARHLRELSEEKGVVTQMGNQGTAGDGLREAVEVLRADAIGDVTSVHVWTNRPVWPQAVGRPAGEDPIPAHLNWDSWIGPAPMRPYKQGVYHPFKWRGWVDFGTGALGDMACHTTNLPIMALHLFDPIAITAVKNPGLYENETYPSSSLLKFEFPEREGMAACDMYWYDGGELPPEELTSELPEGFKKKISAQRQGGPKTSGMLAVGTNGMLFSADDYGQRYYLLPRDGFSNYEKPEQTLPRIPFNGAPDERQKWEFVKSITGEHKPGTMSNFTYAGRLTETILIGNLALRVGEGDRIEWDAKNLKATNVQDLSVDVNQFVHREYREGWTL